MEEPEVELIDYLNILWRWKWLIALGTLACVLVAGLVSMVLPKTYRVGATIGTGDLSEAREKDVERLVARINAGSFDQGAVALTAQFKKPFLIDLSMQTERPVEAVEVLQRTANAVIDELDRLLKVQQEQGRLQVDSIRTQIEAAKQEKITLLAQLQSDFNRRVRAAKLERESVRVKLETLKQNRTLLKLRIEELRSNLDQLQKARAEALPRVENPAGVLVLTQLSSEIVQKETALADLQQQLTVQFPVQLQEAEVREWRLSDQINALEQAAAVLHEHKMVNSPQEIRKVQEAVYAVALPGPPDVNFVESAVRELNVEIPEKLRALEQQAAELTQRASGVRPARLLIPPKIPQTPIHPRVKLNLVVSFLVGLIGLVLLAFFVEYVRQATARRWGNRLTGG